MIEKYVVKGLNLGLKIAVISDLHDCDYKPSLEALKTIKPDVILMPGDIFERQDKVSNLSFLHTFRCSIKDIDSRNGWTLVQEAKKICPVIISRGNHEMYYGYEDKKIFQIEDIYLLDNEYVSLTIKGKQILFGGLK